MSSIDSNRKQFWLFKTEPETFSLTEWRRLPGEIALWDGVRNYQARNTLRDLVQVGDEILVHYSSCEVPGIAGIATVTETGVPDPSAFDPASPYFDPKSHPESPTWYAVRAHLDREFKQLVPLATLKATRGLERMMVCQKGARLSIQPVRPDEFRIVLKLARVAGRQKQ